METLQERKEKLEAVLKRNEFDILATSKQLGVSRPTIYRHCRQLGIKIPPSIITNDPKTGQLTSTRQI